VEVLSSRTILRPRSFERSLAFYRDVLGLRVYREYGAAGRTTGVVLFTGGGFLELTLATPPDDATPGATTLWLQVPDLAAEAERLRTAGVGCGEPDRKPWGLLELWFADPDGHPIVLVEVPEGHPLRTRLD
jgi:catechol 2,3-dioxygenase-like lactoylglutathione lyase family enzyme